MTRKSGKSKVALVVREKLFDGLRYMEVERVPFSSRLTRMSRKGKVSFSSSSLVKKKKKRGGEFFLRRMTRWGDRFAVGKFAATDSRSENSRRIRRLAVPELPKSCPRVAPELPQSCLRVAQSYPNLHHKELPGLFPTYYTNLATFASLKNNA